MKSDDFVPMKIDVSNYHNLRAWLCDHIGYAGSDYEWVFANSKTLGVRIFDNHKRLLFMMRWV